MEAKYVHTSIPPDFHPRTEVAEFVLHVILCLEAISKFSEQVASSEVEKPPRRKQLRSRRFLNDARNDVPFVENFEIAVSGPKN
jgi:hypothetical protein